MSQADEQSGMTRGMVRHLITWGGVLVTVAGLYGSYIAVGIVLFVWTRLGDPHYPFTPATAIYQSLWLAAALCTAIAGVSLIVSGLRRRQYDLIPGPTLYFLGLSLTLIGLFLLVYGAYAGAAAAIAGGLLLIYWEWAYHVS